MLRYRSGNTFSCPMVIRVPIGGYLRGRRAVSQPVGREHLRALPGDPHRVPVERAGRRRPAADRDPLRRSGALPRAQAPVPADLQQGPVPGPDYMVPFGRARAPARGHRRRRDHVGRARAADAARRAAGREGRPERRGARPADDHAVRLDGASPSRCSSATAWSSRTRTSSRAASAPRSPRASPTSCSTGSTRRSAAWRRMDTPVAYAPELEEEILPQSGDVLAAVREIARY